jgi:Na+/melibiose symporter-like transporter
VPFRYATALNMLNWITFDLVALMLSPFLTCWVAGGNLLAKVNLFGMQVALQSAVLGTLFIVAILFLPFWTWVARHWEKRLTYIAGMAFWGIVLLATLLAQPGAIGLVFFLTVLSGISASTTHVLPDAIFPDVVEWDELRIGRRHEGVYYGPRTSPAS